MKPDDFFEGDGWHRRLDVTLLRLVRKGPLDGVSDLDAALGLTQLAEEGFNRLGNFGQRLDDGGIAEVLQSQRVVLRRLGIDFRFPFYDFRAFYRYCEKHQFATWDHLPLINEFFAPALERLEELNGLRVKGSDLPIPARRITEVTRRRIMESIRVTNNAWQYLNWTGSILTEIEFLDQIYDLDSLPSSDSRFLTARNDIYQHCINNPDDLPTDWIFHDWRFGLTDSDDHLLRFLAQMLHPEVRPDAEEVERLRVRFNEILQHDGYEIVPVEWISGAPVFGSRRIGAATPGAVKQLVFAADGPKPKIVLADLVSGDIRITENEQYCLVYDQPIKRASLTWGDLLAWWRTRRSFPKEVPDVDVAVISGGDSTHRYTSFQSQRSVGREAQSKCFFTPTPICSQLAMLVPASLLWCHKYMCIMIHRHAGSAGARIARLGANAWIFFFYFHTASGLWWR
ncbi:hypothetical protein ACFQY7_16205 [Actinomadura luteofluorescens]|uniref:AbiJ-related protein n=1 Tax=Actinomadura luteofluorescens TaxID=46163 RepID=UPI00362E66DB